jgi:hypothetical protein
MRVRPQSLHLRNSHHWSSLFGEPSSSSLAWVFYNPPLIWTMPFDILLKARKLVGRVGFLVIVGDRCARQAVIFRPDDGVYCFAVGYSTVARTLVCGTFSVLTGMSPKLLNRTTPVHPSLKPAEQLPFSVGETRRKSAWRTGRASFYLRPLLHWWPPPNAQTSGWNPTLGALV